MRLTRRAILAACAGAVTARPCVGNENQADSHSTLGLVIHSFAVRGSEKGFSDPIRYLEYCRSLGAGGIQVGIGARADAYADDLRTRAEAASMFVEGSVSLPRDESDVDRFTAEIRTAKRVGADVVRTVMLEGRRYETFDNTVTFRRAGESAFQSLMLAARVVAREGVRLAVENHKDWRADEWVALLKRVGSDHVGVCLDTGNNLALLDDPMEVVEKLAPLAITTHIKDMAVEEYPDGFLLSEVPLGAGILDLPRIVSVIRKAHPEIRFNLEMITRDPLKIPCLTERYWSTFPDLPARHLAKALSFVRTHRPERPLPRISSLAHDARVKAEDANVRQCLDYWNARLAR
jgi:3-oxoisoapionate decarboxylase